MGIDRDIASLLFWFRKQGVDFTRPLTLGRTGLHLSVAQLEQVLHRFGFQKTRDEVVAMFKERNGYAEPLFKVLGAKEVDSLDASAFEGASIVHDLNNDVPAAWHGQYTVVLDGGTLEHVFQFPTALRNCMEMVCLGGHFIAVTPTNNYSGHGFYQFSPELFARVFQEENGFELIRMLVFEVGSNRCYEVRDPAKTGGRVSLVNDRPTLLVACARRNRLCPILTRPPLQSDYVAEWSESTAPRACREADRQNKRWLRRLARRIKKQFKPRYPSKSFTRVDLA